MNRRALWALLAATAAATADETPPEPTSDAAIVAMKAQAARPGDEALTCDQVQAEVVATVNAPEVQSVIQQQGGWAKAQIDKMQQGQQQADSSQAAQPSMAGQVVRSLAMGLIPANPVTGYAQVAAAASQNQALAAEARKNQAEMMAKMQQMMTIMPQIMRAAHLAEIGQAKGCEFMAAETAPK